MNLKPISEWGMFENKRPILIAGPCSAETPEQVMATARELAARNVKIFRAGIWKPRTRPGNFEGVGSEGLQWLKRVKQETGMLTTTEVANTTHVFETLKAGIDILWIGARTTSNPFAMQEIADALKGADIPILIKNPVNPDIELWLGAIERLYDAGITRIGVIHRGFSGMSKSIYRNDPVWQIPIEMRRRYPDMPMFCDPSHISGNRKLIEPVSQKAMDLNFDGLMIESHIDPDCALSDAKQQITPARLSEIIDNLVIRHRHSQDAKMAETLEELRAHIDELDNRMLDILQNRMEISKQIGTVKKQNAVTIYQPGRWDAILKTAVEKGEKKGLTENFVAVVFKAIHQESINIQTEIMNSDAPEHVTHAD